MKNLYVNTSKTASIRVFHRLATDDYQDFMLNNFLLQKLSVAIRYIFLYFRFIWYENIIQLIWAHVTANSTGTIYQQSRKTT